MKRSRAPRSPFAINPARTPSVRRQLGDLIAMAVLGAHAGLLWLMWGDRALPSWLGWLLLVLAVVSMFVYAHDKRAARRGSTRIPETRLHLLELAGGWPGALLAQRWLRHKNRKLRYQFAFWACAVLHETALLQLWRAQSQIASG